jgi:CheY-like chemotaxis protein
MTNPNPSPISTLTKAAIASRLVLIADDNRDAADSLAAIVRDEGYRVHTAYDGREAIDAAARLRPDVVLLDIGMPKLTGYEAARLFRRQEDTARPVLIAVTAWVRESDKLRAQMAGFRSPRQKACKRYRPAEL